MMIIVLRSFKLGLISMVPNLFPVLIAIGFMGYAGIYLSMALVTFGAIIIGIAVDDTIHFFILAPAMMLLFKPLGPEGQLSGQVVE